MATTTASARRPARPPLPGARARRDAPPGAPVVRGLLWGLPLTLLLWAPLLWGLWRLVS